MFDDIRAGVRAQRPKGGEQILDRALDAAGGESMFKTTQQNLKKPMSTLFIETSRETVMVNGVPQQRTVKTEEIINTATINGIFKNRFQITGLESQEARDLALLLPGQRPHDHRVTRVVDQRRQRTTLRIEHLAASPTLAPDGACHGRVGGQGAVEPLVDDRRGVEEGGVDAQVVVQGAGPHEDHPGPLFRTQVYAATARPAEEAMFPRR